MTGTASARDGGDRASGLIAALGGRVRDARARMGLSRRALSERSGVSQRYLAQIESGHGNVSILILVHVADALGLRIEWLLAADDPWTSDTVTISERLRSATPAQRARVLAILGPNGGVRAGRIAFIGLRGAGKSTLGRLTAERLAVPFREIDEDIARASGMPAGEVMALYGQEGYRHFERQALERIVAGCDRLILAIAGGIVAQPETYNYLLRNFHTVWLKATPEEHMARVRGQGDERPMAGNPDAMAVLRNILTAREALYARAEAHVDTSRTTPRACVDAIVAVIAGKRFLAPPP
jgi:XRE family transcriptional regulator, aerobic/anaerobic benzoate catabolism transcriptional regulator